MERDAVLVIDDDPDFREMVQMLLGDSVTVFEAADCAAGLELLERERARVRLVLLDYWMPGKTPGECARCLMERAAPGVDVVLVTAAPNAAERAAELGIPRYLSKPFEIEQLERLALRRTPAHEPGGVASR
jgi:CheY-like chemotaxis protein